MPRSEFSYHVLSTITRKIRKRKIADNVVYEKGDRDVFLVCYRTSESFREDLVKIVIEALLKDYKTTAAVNREKESWISCVTKDGSRPFSVILEFFENKERVIVCIQIKL